MSEDANPSLPSATIGAVLALGGALLLACGSPSRPLVDSLSSGSGSASNSNDGGARFVEATVPRLPLGASTRPVDRVDDFLATTNIPPDWAPDIAGQYLAHVYVPRNLTGHVMMMVFGPQGSNVDALSTYQTAADARRLLVVAVDGYKPQDNSDARSHEYYYCALKLFDDLRRDGILAADASFVLAGFSGGAKMAMAIGEYGGTIFRGVIAAGCNVDLASYAAQSLDNPSSRNLHFVLVNASDDPVVGGATATVAASLMQSGFTNVSTIPYTGGHTFPPLAVFLQALDLVLTN
jgi:hypothetical protein